MKKIFYFTIAVFAMVVFSLESCKKEIQSEKVTANQSKDLNSMTIKNDRLVFNDLKAVSEAITATGAKTPDQLDAWEKTINFISYRKLSNNAIMENWNRFKNGDSITPDTQYDQEIPRFVCSIINQKGEMQVMDSIYYHRKNQIYIFPYEGEAKLKTTENEINNLTKSISSNIRCITIRCETGKIINKTNLKSTAGEWSDAKYQYAFVSNGGTTFKYVFAVHLYYYPTYNEYLTLSNYMEYRKNGAWYKAGETTNKMFNVGVYANGTNYSIPTILPNYTGYTTDNGFFDHQISLGLSDISSIIIYGTIGEYLTNCPLYKVSDNLDSKNPSTYNPYDLWYFF